MDINDFLSQPKPTPEQVRAAELDVLRVKLQRVTRDHNPARAGTLSCHLQALTS
jgi:hypothetical protein